MSELSKKVESAIENVRGFQSLADRYGGYYLAFSGGKDSVVTKRILDMAGVQYESFYRVSSVDPPELVQFIKRHHKDVRLEIPHDDDGRPITMWSLIPKKRTPPSRIARYCCEFLKESGGDGRLTVTGVRWAESSNRKRNHGLVTVKKNGKKILRDDDANFHSTPRGGVVLVNDNSDSRRVLEQCVVRSKVLLNPIIDWTDADVWEFIKAEGIPYCSLYDEGFHRLGCIGCPMARQHGREREFARWPKYKTLYLLAFKKMIEARKERGIVNKACWDTPEDVFNWWMEYDELPGQMNIIDEYENETVPKKGKIEIIY